MSYRIAVVFAALLALLTFPAMAEVQPVDAPVNWDTSEDYHSYSNPEEIQIEHLDLELTANFDKHILSGTATLTLERMQPDANELILDTRGLTIKKVTARVDGEWKPVEWSLGETDPVLGTPLTISVPPESNKVRIRYHTSPDAYGLQWLSPEQTPGKYPFMYSQSEAIYARTWVPLQDTPKVRFTYTATIHTPEDLKAVMSAINDPQDYDGTYHFKMPQPIPSYLMAIAIGNLEFEPLSEHTGVYALPTIIDEAAWEFANTQKMINVIESLYGPYRWGRYDLLVLPPAFPYGGMENPRLSYITPTVIAGDRSLVSVIAHELAHSWSGNLVTNATWRDFWLNEGFTVYVERRVMEELYGKDRAKMEAALGYRSLQKAFEELKPEWTQLAIDIRNVSPDAAFSAVPYEKGYLFLLWLENQFGRETFDKFLRGYFDHFAFQSITTERFLAYLRENLLEPHPGVVSMEEVFAWVYQPYLPEGHPVPQSDAFEKVAAEQKAWLSGKQPLSGLSADSWVTQEWIYFLEHLPRDLSEEQMKQLDEAFGLTQSTNSQIAQSWLKLAIANEYKAAYDRLENYLDRIGRRSLIVPLYEALMKYGDEEFARRVYEEARPGYHSLTKSSLDPILYPDKASTEQDKEKEKDKEAEKQKETEEPNQEQGG